MIGAILMMAGNGSRMKINQNKVFLPLGNQMVFEHSLKLFLSMGLEVVCVIRKEDIAYLEKYKGKIKIVVGGDTRQQSVLNGLRASTSDAVLIHDAARPFVTKKIIEDCCKAIQNKNAFMVVAPCKDSIYEMKPLKSLKRDELVLAQTPQGGNRLELMDCHERALEEHMNVTDDASLILKYGKSLVELVQGSDVNFKITTQLDYIMAKELMKHV